VLCDLIAVTDLGYILGWNCTTIYDYCSTSLVYQNYITCDLDLKITSISLKTVGISGTLPSSLGYLWSLTALDFSYNSLSSSIPSTFGGLTSLKYLALNYNNLNGSIPSSFRELSAIMKLELPGNLLTGTIPAIFENAISLNYLDFSVNRLTGTIPYLGDAYYLSTILLQFNKLIGSIPPTLCTTSLNTLSVIGNAFACYPSCLTAKRNLVLDVRSTLSGCTSSKGFINFFLKI